MSNVLIIVKGGNVQGVECEDPNTVVKILDYDNYMEPDGYSTAEFSGFDGKGLSDLYHKEFPEQKKVLDK